MGSWSLGFGGFGFQGLGASFRDILAFLAEELEEDEVLGRTASTALESGALEPKACLKSTLPPRGGLTMAGRCHSHS